MKYKMAVDVFMLTNTKNIEYFNITKDAILSLKLSESTVGFNVFLIEGNLESEFDELYKGLGCSLISFNDNFGFSKAMNYALRHGKNKYALLTNNDVKFTKDWFDEISKHLDLEDVAVWSTNDPNLNFNTECQSEVIEGYKPTVVHSGWCYLIDTHKLGSNRFLSEEFDVWFMDDDFCMRLQNLGLKQVWCRKSIVYHLNGSSNEMREDFQRRIDIDKTKFINKYNEQIRVYRVQFFEDRTIINFESFSEGQYTFSVSGDANYQTVIDMKPEICYYITIGRVDNITFSISYNHQLISSIKLNNFCKKSHL